MHTQTHTDACTYFHCFIADKQGASSAKDVNRRVVKDVRTMVGDDPVQQEVLVDALGQAIE